MAPTLTENFVATIEAAAAQMEMPARTEVLSASDDTLPAREVVLRELLDDSHTRLREIGRSLQSLKDYLTI